MYISCLLVNENHKTTNPFKKLLHFNKLSDISTFSNNEFELTLMTLANESAPLEDKLHPVKLIEFIVVEFFKPLHRTESKTKSFKNNKANWY